MWSAWNGILPYLLHFLDPVLGVLILLSLGPFLFNRIMAFIQGQLDEIKTDLLQIHYHQLAMSDLGDGFDDILTNGP